MGVKVTGQFEPAGEFSIVDAKDVSGNITSSNIQLSGNISGSTTSTGSFGRLEIIGNSVLGGDLDLTGNITIGDSDTDSLTITADLTSNLIPNADSTFNLGSPTKNWKEGYIEQLSSTNITASGDISGSGISTGSLAHLHVSNNIGIGTPSPLATVHISASDGLIIPVGTNAQRSGDAVVGEIRFNTDAQTYEGYDGNNWGSLGGMTDVDKDTFITAENSAGTDNDELKFFTAGNERLRIFADGHISASGNITASSNLKVDGDLIVSGLTNPNISDFSSSLDSKITSITSSVSALKSDSGSFSTRITQATASIFSITSSISALKVDSSSISTRLTTEESNVDALQVDSSSFSTRITADSSSFSERITTDSSSLEIRITQATASIDAITSSIDALKVDSSSFSTRITQATSSIAGITASIDALKTDSGSFSTRITDLKIDSGSFSLRNTNLETTSSALINNFDQVQSVGKTDSVDFNNVTTTGNVSGSLTSTGSFGMIKKDGLDIREHFSRNLAEAFELDSNGDFQPSPMNKYIVDTRWDLDENGDLQLRNRELWTLFTDDYFSD